MSTTGCAAANGNSLNAWVGSEANDMTVSGADGVWNTMYMDLYPEVRINPCRQGEGQIPCRSMVDRRHDLAFGHNGRPG